MRFDDDVRIKILEALLSKNAVAPNLSEIKRLTGFHKATIKQIAKEALAKKIEHVVFDRGGYLYHGRVKALADAAREGGLDF